MRPLLIACCVLAVFALSACNSVSSDGGGTANTPSFSVDRPGDTPVASSSIPDGIYVGQGEVFYDTYVDGSLYDSGSFTDMNAETFNDGLPVYEGRSVGPGLTVTHDLGVIRTTATVESVSASGNRVLVTYLLTGTDANGIEWGGVWTDVYEFVPPDSLSYSGEVTLSSESVDGVVLLMKAHWDVVLQ